MEFLETMSFISILCPSRHLYQFIKGYYKRIELAKLNKHIDQAISYVHTLGWVATQECGLWRTQSIRSPRTQVKLDEAKDHKKPPSNLLAHLIAIWLTLQHAGELPGSAYNKHKNTWKHIHINTNSHQPGETERCVVSPQINESSGVNTWSRRYEAPTQQTSIQTLRLVYTSQRLP